MSRRSRSLPRLRSLGRGGGAVGASAASVATRECRCSPQPQGSSCAMREYGPCNSARVGRRGHLGVRRRVLRRTSGPSFGWRSGVALSALTVCFARAIARARVFVRRPDGGDDRGVIAALLVIFIFFRSRRRWLRQSRCAGPVRAATRCAAAPDRGYLGCRLPGRRHALRCGDQLGTTGDDGRRAVHSDGTGSSRSSSSAAAAAIRRAEADVDPADCHAAVRVAWRLVVLFRPHRHCHGWLDAWFRHCALALLYGPARVTLANFYVLADRVMILYGALTAIATALEEPRRRCARRVDGCSHRDVAAVATGLANDSCWASSKAWPTSQPDRSGRQF